MIYGHRSCSTSNAKWLALMHIYGKFHRPNVYDIGGTYNQGVPDFWFTFSTEQVGDIFLLHIFAATCSNSSCSVGLSNSSEITINKKNNNLYLSKTVKIHRFQSKETKQSYLTTYSFSNLDVELMKNRKLNIAVTFPEYINQDSEVKPNVTCYQDFSALLKDPVGADFTVESEDGVQYKVHKGILCARSDVFKAMLKSETAESQQNCVKLMDASAEDIHSMLEFIYSGTIKDMDNVNFSTVLMLADRYNLPGLHQLSTLALSRQINLENALEILVLSDLYGSETLKHNAMKFIKSNRDVLESQTFNEINSVPLLKELCLYLSS